MFSFGRLRLPLVFVAVGVGVSVLSLEACVGDDPGGSSSGVDPNADGGGGGDSSTTGSDGSTSNDSDTASNDSGGSDTSTPTTKPTVTDVAAGNGFACAVLSDKTVMCWGASELGQTAQPAAGDVACAGGACRPPTLVAGLKDVTRVFAGNSTACAISGADSDLYCWGLNDHAQLGVPSNTALDLCLGSQPCSRAPKKISGVSSIVEVALAKNSVCAVTKTGRVFCWGANGLGQLAKTLVANTDDPPEAATFFDSPPNNGVTKITADIFGVGHFCAIRADATVWCWGRNPSGEADPSATTFCPTGGEPCVSPPKKVSDGLGPFANVQAVSASNGASCVALSSGVVWCWGYRGHGIPDVPATSGSVGATIASPGAMGLGALTGSFTHTCGLLLGTGDVRCWGTNASGELGVPPKNISGTSCFANIPCTNIRQGGSNISGASKVAAGTSATFVITPQGKLFGFGVNVRATLGHVPTAAEIDAGADAGCQSACSPTPVEIIPP